MSDKNNNGGDEPEVIIIPPREQSPGGDIDSSLDAGLDEAAALSDAPVKKASRTGTWISLLVVAAFVGGFVAWPKLYPQMEPWLPDSLKPSLASSDKLVEVTKAMDELALRIATLKGSAIDRDALVDLEDKIDGQLAGLAAKIKDLGMRPVLPEGLVADVANLAQEIDALKKLQVEAALGAASSPNQTLAISGDASGENMIALGQAMDDLSARLMELENNTSPSTPPEHSHDHAHEDVMAQVDALKTLTTELAQRLSGAEARLAVVADASAGGAGAALVAATGQLRSRIDTGQAFGADLATVQKLVGDEEEYEILLKDLQTASAGVATLTHLQREFSAIAGDVVAAAQAPATNWAAKIWRRLSSMISVRRTGDVAGDDIAAHIARAENRLVGGDLAAALRELKDLSNASLNVAGPWLDQAGQRVRAMRALDDLTRRAVQRMTNAAGAN